MRKFRVSRKRFFALESDGLEGPGWESNRQPGKMIIITNETAVRMENQTYVAALAYGLRTVVVGDSAV